MGFFIIFGLLVLIILTFLRIGHIRDMMEHQVDANERLIDEIQEIKEELKKSL